MTGADDHRSSTVADEAVRLAAALAGLTTPTSDGGDGDAGEQAPRSSARPAAEGPACSCSSPSVQAVCDVCPVCRVAAFLSEVRPETVERVADLLTMVVGSLEAFAEHRRTEMAGSEPSDHGTAPDDADERAGWQPVEVEGEDEDS